MASRYLQMKFQLVLIKSNVGKKTKSKRRQQDCFLEKVIVDVLKTGKLEKPSGITFFWPRSILFWLKNLYLTKKTLQKALWTSDGGILFAVPE